MCKISIVISLLISFVRLIRISSLIIAILFWIFLWIYFYVLYLCNSGRQPLFLFTVDPDSNSALAFFIRKLPLTMSDSIFPISLILLTFWPCIAAISMLFVVLILTFIHSTIRPCVYSFSMELIIFPLSIIDSTIYHFHDTSTMNSIIFPFSRVRSSVIPLIRAQTIFITSHKIPFIFGSILSFNSKSSGFVVFNFSFIAFPVCVDEFAFSLRISSYEISDILVTIWVFHLSFTMWFLRA